MRKILRLLVALSLLVLVFPPALQAQQRTITGTVLSDDNKTPMSGVTVRVKGTRRITQTNADGKFSIQVNSGETLQISYVGYESQDVNPGSGNEVGISLKSTDGTLGEVVVTAMDIKRNSRELGYSAQKLGGKEIAETQRENFLNSLQGRVAGLTVTPTTGQAGASSQIVLRGFNTLSLNNQPLFVVDGIILDNSTINETSNGGTALGLASDRPNRNSDYTNRIADLNPADIEQVTVLKGPEATALYGSQASGGAIVITTKKAQTGRFSVNYDNSFRFSEISRYVDVDNTFSPGTNGVPGSTFSYYGPRYPEGTRKFDNIGNFFQTGFAQTHNLSADFGTKNLGFRVSGSMFDQKGVVPTNAYKKYNVRFTNTTKIGKFIELTPSFQYITSETEKPLRSAGGYLLGLYVWPSNRDIRRFEDENGNKLSAFSADPYAETDNPLYNVNRNRGFDNTKRYIVSGGININPFDWLSVSGRFGYDHYETTGYTFYHPLSQLTSRAQLGALDNFWRKYNGYNHTITATAKKSIGKFSGRLMVGTMWQDYQTEMFAIYGTGLIDSVGLADGKMYKFINGVRTVVTDATFDQLVGPRTDSSITRPNTRVRLLRNNMGEYNQYISRQIAYFGEAALSYNNYLFLSYTRRFESASVFPKDFRNYNYPGFSLSAIISDMFPKVKGKIVNFWKLRTSLAQTARLADPYKNQSVFVNNFTSSNVGLIYSYGFDNNNPFLAPEKQKTYEIGTELRLWSGKLGIDMAYYNTLCTDQISQQFRASYATGFILNTQNAASTRNQGVELIVDFAAMKKKDFTWNMRFNFNRAWSEVLKLPDAIQYEYYIADTWLYGNARGGLIRGGSTSTITGFHYLRNNKGQIIISPATGVPVVEQTFTIIGNRQPDFTLGTVNTFRYRNWSLNFLLDLKVGGDVFNATEMYLTIQGKSKRTLDRETPRVIEGVLQDGRENSGTPTANNIVITPQFNQAYYTTMPEEEFVQKDVNFLKLRDLTLSYMVPSQKLGKSKIFKTLSFFVTGNDLFLLSNYRGADPAVNGNTAGSSGVGGFGFDYGSLPAPVSVNLGLRAGF
ncbi:MAG: SusC/RagA family TonB-linked outer membrane protein [Chitinophagaceae bacterium]|nr:SusC/RagA family TonB-linked outer membrane protein [Chitinophagaceae bacterium]